MKQEAINLVAEKLKLWARVEEIGERLGEIDPYNRLENTAKKAAARMNGVNP